MEKEEVDIIIKKLPGNSNVLKDVLNIVRNNKTKIVESDNIKGNYYSFLNDTMYISKIANNTNDYNRIVVLCHECIHSIQNKALQLINTIISHLVLLSYIVAVFFIIFGIEHLNILLIPLAILAIVIRGILELDAMTRSVILYKKYVDGKLSNDEIDKSYNYFSKNIKIGRIFYLIKIAFDKILPIIILFLINYFKYHIFK